MDKKIVFCGGGNMAEGIIASLISKNVAEPQQITVSEILPERCRYLTDTYGVTADPAVSNAMKTADVIFIAVVPRHVPAVAASLSSLAKKDALIISIAAGMKLETLGSLLGEDRKIVRTIPNTLHQSANGYSAVCPNNLCLAEDCSLVNRLFGALGQVMELSEDMFNAFTAFSNVGPLWVYKMTEALIDAGVYVGFNRKDARSIVLKTLMGASGVLELTGEHPSVKVDQMTSPGGVTIESLRALSENGFSNALMRSVIAGFNKVNSLE